MSCLLPGKRLRERSADKINTFSQVALLGNNSSHNNSMASRHACRILLQIAAFMSAATVSCSEEPLLVNYMIPGSSLTEYKGDSSFIHISKADIPDRILISMCWESQNPKCIVHALTKETTLGYLCHNGTAQYTVKYQEEFDCMCSSGDREKGQRMYHDVFTYKSGPKWSITENRTKCVTSEFLHSVPESHTIRVKVYKSESIKITVCTEGIMPFKGNMFNRKYKDKFLYLEKEGINITYPLYKCENFSGDIKKKNLSQVIDEYNLSVSNGQETLVASLYNISRVVKQMIRGRRTTSTPLPTLEDPNYLSLSIMTDPPVNSGTFSSKVSVGLVAFAFCAGHFGRPFI